MTREEQIRKAAHSGDDNVHAEQYPIPGVADMFNGYFATCFELGAKWADQHPAWVSVKDSLPEDNECCLIYGDCGIDIGSYNSKTQYWLSEYSGQPTHWMPLPESPATKGGTQ